MHLKICILVSEDAISQLANIVFWVQHTKIPLIGIAIYARIVVFRFISLPDTTS